MSDSSVITNDETDPTYKRGVNTDFGRVKFAMLDPMLTATVSKYQTACGATDIMMHTLERYFHQGYALDFTDQLSFTLLKEVMKNAPIALEHPDDYDARANIMWAGTVAHTNIVGVGREQDWNSHGIEHELSALYDCAHGAGLAVIMPAWMEFVYKHNVMRFCQMATRVFGCEMDFENPENTALAGIRAFRRFLHDIGMPINFDELGASQQDIPKLVEKFGLGDGRTGGFVALSSDDVAQIYQIAANAKL
jgi:alcohol dehydrogenase YqhD (iron-dependent ADH family)